MNLKQLMYVESCCTQQCFVKKMPFSGNRSLTTLYVHFCFWNANV